MYSGRCLCKDFDVIVNQHCKKGRQLQATFSVVKGTEWLKGDLEIQWKHNQLHFHCNISYDNCCNKLHHILFILIQIH